VGSKTISSPFRLDVAVTGAVTDGVDGVTDGVDVIPGVDGVIDGVSDVVTVGVAAGAVTSPPAQAETRGTTASTKIRKTLLIIPINLRFNSKPPLYIKMLVNIVFLITISYITPLV